MAFGQNPSFIISGKLSYHYIKDYCEKTPKYRRWEQERGEWNIYDGRSDNYALGLSYDGVYDAEGQHVRRPYAYVRLYRTQILKFYESGAFEANLYNSHVTWDMINRFGPMQFYGGRDGYYFSDAEGNDWPAGHGDRIHVNPDGMLDGVVKTYHEHVRPEVKKFRRAKAKEIRSLWRGSAAMARILLGEFDHLVEFAREYHGWTVSVPDALLKRQALFNLLAANTDHAPIATFIQKECEVLENQSWGRKRGELVYTSAMYAAQAVERLLFAAMMEEFKPRYGDYIHETKEHTGIRVWNR